MKTSPLAGKPAQAAMLVNVPRLITAYYSETPDPSVAAQRVAFGTSGHRGSAFEKAFPFYLRTGKRLARQASEIAIQFRGVPHQSFPAESTLDWQSSRLVMSIQPDEGMVLRFQAKHPGAQMDLRSVEMQFNYQDAFAIRSPDAYETLLWDVMKNDATLFVRADQVEPAWRLLMPVLDVWAVAPPSDFPNYAAGTWGREDAPGLLAQGHNWPLPTELVGQCKKQGKTS